MVQVKNYKIVKIC